MSAGTGRAGAVRGVGVGVGRGGAVGAVPAAVPPRRSQPRAVLGVGARPPERRPPDFVPRPLPAPGIPGLPRH